MRVSRPDRKSLRSVAADDVGDFGVVRALQPLAPTTHLNNRIGDLIRLRRVEERFTLFRVLRDGVQVDCNSETRIVG